MDIPVLLWALLPVALFHWRLRRRPGFLPMQLLANLVLGCLVFWPMFSGALPGPGLVTEDRWGAPSPVAGSPEQTDVSLQFHPWWDEVRRLVRAGEPPWISDRIGGGVPLLANGQTGLPFPLHLPVWVLGPERGTAVMAVWKLELALVGLFLLLNRLRAAPAAAALGALTYAFGLYSLSWLVVPLTWVVAAAPWGFWLLLGALRGGRWSGAALAVVLGLVTGWSTHPESAVFLWLALGLVGAVLAAWSRRRMIRVVAPLALALPIGLGIGLPVVATIADSAKLSEARSSAAYPMPGVDVPLRIRALALVVTPWREGHPADNTWGFPFPAAALTLGIGTIPLCVLLAARPRKRLRRFSGAFAAFGVCSAVLVWQVPGLSQFLARLPVLGTMVWARAGFLIGLALAVTGALALDGWLRHPRRHTLCLAAASWLLIAGVLIWTGAPAGRRHGVPALAAPAAVSVAAWAAPAAVAAVVPVAATLELLFQGWRVLGWSEPTAPEEVVAVIRQEASAESGARVLGQGWALPPNLGAHLGLADLRSNDPVRPRSLARLHQALGVEGEALPGPVTKPWAGLAGAWGVSTLVTGPEGVNPETAAGWDEAWSGPGGRVFTNRRALPILRVAENAVVPPGNPVSGDWETLDFSRVAAVVDNPPELGGTATVRVVCQRPWRWRAEARSVGRTLVILHVPWAPGWRAAVNGERRPTINCNLGAMGVALEDGVHWVEWRYRPPGLIAGIAISALGLLASVTWGGLPAALGRIRRGRRQSPSRGPAREQ